MATRKLTIAVAALALTFGLILAASPTLVTIAPEATVTVVNATGQVVPGATVEEIWQEYSVERYSNKERLTTDINGTVQLPIRTIRVSLLGRIGGCLANVLETFFHTSCGPSASVIARIGSLSGFAYIKSSTPVRLVLQKEWNSLEVEGEIEGQAPILNRDVDRQR